MYSTEEIRKVDPQIADAIEAEVNRQRNKIELIASENFVSNAVIEAMGQPFDTDVHEAVAQFPVQDEEQKGKVFDVVQTGYTLNGKVIRFAKVVVGI